MKILLLCFLLGIHFGLRAQVVGGTVRDADSRETLVGVNILLIETGQGTTTDAFGHFSLRINTGEQQLRLRFSYVGYPGLDTTLAVGETAVDIALRSRYDLPEVVVRDRAAIDANQLGIVQVPVRQLNRVPALMGETDPLKALAFMPGIATGVEGTSDLYVRGGTPDQNLILLDGAKVYNANHLFGFLSPFNPDLLKDVTAYTGAFPARFGGRLSSIIDITAKEGDKKRWHRQAAIGLINSRISANGPLIRDKVSLSVGARTAHLALLNLLTLDESNSQRYFFYDLNTKVNWQTGKSNLSVSAFSSYDRWVIRDDFLDQPNEVLTDWGNRTLSARWAYQLQRALLLRSSLTFNRYEYGAKQLLLERETKAVTGEVGNRAFVNETDARVELHYNLAAWLRLNAGIEAGKRRINPREINLLSDSVEIVIPGLAVTRTREAAYFLEGSFTPTARWKVDLGVRRFHYQIPDQSLWFRFWEPRLAVSRSLGDDWLVKSAYARMNQPLHLLTGNFIGVPNNLWVQANREAPPQRADHWSAGAEKTLPRQLTLSAEGYYKRLRGLVDPRPGTDLFQTHLNGWESLVSLAGEGQAYGTELMLRKTGDRFFGWLSYTLSWSRVRYADVNEGRWYFRQFDRRHDLSLTGGIGLGNRWYLLSNFIFNTGYRLTLPVAVYYDGLSGQAIPVYAGRNNEKSPNYHRLDIAFEKRIERNSGKNTVLTLGLYNAYGRRNPFYLLAEPDLSIDPNQPNSNGAVFIENRVKQFSLFNFLPYVSYSFPF